MTTPTTADIALFETLGKTLGIVLTKLPNGKYLIATTQQAFDSFTAGLTQGETKGAASQEPEIQRLRRALEWYAGIGAIHSKNGQVLIKDGAEVARRVLAGEQFDMGR